MKDNNTEQNILSIIFTQDGFLAESPPDCDDESMRAVLESFSYNKWKALYDTGLNASKEIKCMETPAGIFLRRISERFFRDITALPELELARENIEYVPTGGEIEDMLGCVPFALGTEYIDPEWIKHIFAELLNVFKSEIAGCNSSVASYFQSFRTDLRVPERVFFHMAENKNDPEYPFAFMATYAAVSENGSVSHVPLKHALVEFEGSKDKLIDMLSCLNRAAELSPLIAGFMRKGSLFKPLKLKADEAYDFLRQSADIERAGIICLIPDWWRRRSHSASLSVQIGAASPDVLNANALLSLKPEITVDGVALSQADIRKLQKQTEGLIFLKGRWVEADKERIDDLVRQMEYYKTQGDSISLIDAIRLSAGIETKEHKIYSGSTVTNGKWLAEFMKSLRTPAKLDKMPLPETFHGKLRKYQKTGYDWLCYMDSLNLGACLADDMGLGKTVQVLAYLEMLRTSRRERDEHMRVLLIVPASLIGNWRKETERFVPQMDICVLHGAGSAALDKIAESSDKFLYITTYGMASRLEYIRNISWDCIILDEAQAIKNPSAAQTKAVKKLSGRMHIAMTGTPIENNLGNLWSVFDFIDHGLLGSLKEFGAFVSEIGKRSAGYDKLRNAIMPFMLRRVKTDKTIIRDLPDKIENTEYAGLTALQIALYNQVTDTLEKELTNAKSQEDNAGIERRGMILSAILKLKQICNHPAQYLGHGIFKPEESGKFMLLEELCDAISQKHERVLIFTQFREIIDPLAAFLNGIFKYEGRVIHGGTPVSKRQQYVDEFQSEAYIPYIILSLKAGGTGLNLTNACHVIHFDRWWNPAVENQATDRAFRIGQKKNVMVHKFVCSNTVEERISDIIESKKELADAVIGSGSGEQWITELPDDEIIAMLRLKG